VTIGFVVCAYLYYRWRRRRNPQSSDSPPATQSGPVIPATTRPLRRNRAVWRSEVIPGLPTYTLQARDGELSLGGARKPSTEDEEFELEARPSASHEQGAETLPETNESEGTTSGALELHPPPYIPPPPAAVVRPRTASNA
jgi:hypothetical protein